MERSQLAVGDVVAVYPHSPVPTDPYAAHLRINVRKMVVTSTDVDGQVFVENVVLIDHLAPIADGNAEVVTPRQVIAKWNDWEGNLAVRAARSTQQSDRVQRRIDAEAAALTIAQRDYPSACVRDHCIVIPIDDWLAVNGA